MHIPSLLRALLVGFILSLMIIPSAQADEVYGRIRGTISDPSGAVIPNAKVTVTNIGTGITREVSSASDGSFEFLQLSAPGDYRVAVKAGGFKNYEATGIHLALNQIYVLSVQMEVGAVTQQVVVEAAATQVEQTSMERGASLTSRDVTELPLIGRDWTQLQQTLPGTVSNSDRFGGDYAANGSRAQFNSYMVNGTDANDFTLNLSLFIPSPDAIGEVHIITNTMNPEYGRNSGAILNAVTKSGTNSFHGDGFEFYRDTSLNTRNFFQPTSTIFHQNLFGGTIGGPIWKNHTFFFFSYQGNRNVSPQSGGQTTVFTADQRDGIFPNIGGDEGAANCAAAGLSCSSPFPLLGEDGTTYPAGTAYSTIFPTGHIPSQDLNSIAVNLMKTYVPLPNNGTEYDFNPTTTGVSDQEIIRIDHTFSPKDAIWGYTFMQRHPTTDFLPFSGATLPGFGSTDKRHLFSGTLAWNHTFGGTALNEARLGYSRFNYVSNYPQKVVDPSSAGFNITPQWPQYAGLPVMSLTGYFDLGFSNNGPQPRITPTYQFTDNFSKLVGKHTFKVGFEMRRMQVYNPFLSSLDGDYTFGGAGAYSTGDPGADFLLGIPDSYAQNTGDVMDVRAQEYSAYFQDQFKLRKDLTLTYGANWQDDTPSVDIYHQGKAINCWIPGQQSTVFPTAPAGLNWPGDAGCTRSGYSNHPAHFGPKIGFAWSPGASGKTSIRGGYGIYFNRTEEELTLQNLNAPPWGLNSQGVTSSNPSFVPSFADPWADIAGGGSTANPFPYSNPAPGANFDFGQLGYYYLLTTDPKFTVPYVMNYNLTVERELGGNTVLSVAYVGSIGRKLHSIYNNNFDVKPAACLAGVGDEAGCAANRVYQKLLYPQNERYTGVSNYGPIGIGSESTFLNSNYSSLQITATKRTSHGLTFNAAYTWAHTLDYGSSLEDGSFGGLALDGANLSRNYGNAGIDARHRFTISYVYEFPKLHSVENNFVLSRLINGWEMSGVTTFQTGFPVQVYETTYRELNCDAFDWTACPDRPNNAVPNGLTTYDPRNTNYTDKNGTLKGNYWFNPKDFTLEPLGTLGNAGRNAFHGPGLNNFDWALLKNIKVRGESKYIQLRFEFYNIWNHAQFDAVSTVDAGDNVNGNAASSNFGRITSALDPRLIQLGAKFYF